MVLERVEWVEWVELRGKEEVEAVVEVEDVVEVVVVAVVKLCKCLARPENVSQFASDGKTQTRSTSLLASQIPNANEPLGFKTGFGPRVGPNTGEK